MWLTDIFPQICSCVKCEVWKSPEYKILKNVELKLAGAEMKMKTYALLQFPSEL